MRLLILLPFGSLLLIGVAAQSMTLPTEAPETDGCPACTKVDTLSPCSPDWREAVKACQEPPCNRRYIQDPVVAAGCGQPVLSGTPSSTTAGGQANPDVPYPMPSFTNAPSENGQSMSIPEGTSTGSPVLTETDQSMSIPEGTSTGSPVLTDTVSATLTTEKPSTTTGNNSTVTSPVQEPTGGPDDSAAGKLGLSVMALVPVIVAGLVFAA